MLSTTESFRAKILQENRRGKSKIGA